MGMGAIKIAAFAIAATVAAVTVRSYKPELSLQIGIAAGTVILIYALRVLEGAFATVTGYMERYGLEGEYFLIMLKVAGIAYLMQFATDCCRDANENAIASRVELVARALILAATAPVLGALLELIAEIANGV